MERLSGTILRNAKKADHDVVTILEIVDMCEALHTLPEPGGLYDQDPIFVMLYKHVKHQRSVRAEFDAKRAKARSR